MIWTGVRPAVGGVTTCLAPRHVLQQAKVMCCDLARHPAS